MREAAGEEDAQSARPQSRGMDDTRSTPSPNISSRPDTKLHAERGAELRGKPWTSNRPGRELAHTWSGCALPSTDAHVGKAEVGPAVVMGLASAAVVGRAMAWGAGTPRRAGMLLRPGAGPAAAATPVCTCMVQDEKQG